MTASNCLTWHICHTEKRAKGLLESVVHRKGACCVRWGGVGALEQSRPGLLPDKGQPKKLGPSLPLTKEGRVGVIESLRRKGARDARGQGYLRTHS